MFFVFYTYTHSQNFWHPDTLLEEKVLSVVRIWKPYKVLYRTPFKGSIIRNQEKGSK